MVTRKYMVKDSNRKHCNKQNRMSDTEIITILIYFILVISDASALIIRGMPVNV